MPCAVCPTSPRQGPSHDAAAYGALGLSTVGTEDGAGHGVDDVERRRRLHAVVREQTRKDELREAGFQAAVNPSVRACFRSSPTPAPTPTATRIAVSLVARGATRTDAALGHRHARVSHAPATAAVAGLWGLGRTRSRNTWGVSRARGNVARWSLEGNVTRQD